MNFYKLENDALKIVIGLVNVGGIWKNAQFLTVEEAASVGSYPKADNPPEEREGYRSRIGGYDLTGGAWTTRWEYEPLSVEEMTRLYDDAMEAHLDAEKAARGYTKREPSDYAASGVARYAQDAADWTAHRDAVMLYGLDVQNRAAAGQPVPTLAEFKAGLPVIQWTAEATNG